MNYEINNFSEIVKKSKNLSQVARFLGLVPSKGNRDTIKKYLEIYQLNTDHFGYVRNNKHNNIKYKTEDILVVNSNFSRSSLKKRLYSEGLKIKKCELCGQGDEWNGKYISLILDHINGINNDNRIENLRILCPNCNATLDTHCSKNKTKYRLYLCVDETQCSDCDTLITRGSKRCIKCDSINKRITNRPSTDVLIREVNEIGYTAVGRKYGVSDNAIRKWIKK